MVELVTLLALLMGSAIAGADRAATTYVVDPAASSIRIHVGKAGLFSFAGHTHEVSAPVAEGTVDVVPGELPRSKMRVAFDASALRVTGEGEPAEDVPEVQRTMLSERVLDVSRFPRITFESRRVDLKSRPGADPMQLRVTGDLTVHGITKSAGADVSVRLAAGSLTAAGTITVKQTDFGIEPVTAGAGTVRVKDEVRIDFVLVAVATATPR